MATKSGLISVEHGCAQECLAMLLNMRSAHSPYCGRHDAIPALGSSLAAACNATDHPRWWWRCSPVFPLFSLPSLLFYLCSLPCSLLSLASLVFFNPERRARARRIAVCFMSFKRAMLG